MCIIWAVILFSSLWFLFQGNKIVKLENKTGIKQEKRMWHEELNLFIHD